jgi:hypothetical protein
MSADSVNARSTMVKFSVMHLIVSLLLLLGSCATPQKKDMQQFEWQPTTCAPKAFPVRLLSASLHLADGAELEIQPKSLIANGWGEIGAVSLIGEDMKALPATLDLQWFSYVERKCYGGNFKLDQAKLADVFKKKLTAPATDAKADFTHLVIGLAPKGGVSIWLSGEGVTEEIGHLTAAEVKVDMQSIIGAYPDVEAYAKDVIAKNLPEGQVSLSNVSDDDLMKWAGRYRRDYRWHWDVTSTAPLGGLLAHYFNGEACYWPQAPAKTTSFTQPLPDGVNVRWKTNGNAGSATLLFDDAELFAAFDKLGGPAQEAGIMLEVNRVSGTVKAFVQDAGAIVELKKTRMDE